MESERFIVRGLVAVLILGMSRMIAFWVLIRHFVSYSGPSSLNYVLIMAWAISLLVEAVAVRGDLLIFMPIFSIDIAVIIFILFYFILFYLFTENLV